MEHRVLRRIIAIACLSALATQMPMVALGQQQGASAPSVPAIRATTELVLVNVVARDKKGNLVRDLKQQDFTVLEDGQKQQVSSFDFENIDELALAQQSVTTANGTAAPAVAGATAPAVQHADDARDRRL